MAPVTHPPPVLTRCAGRSSSPAASRRPAFRVLVRLILAAPRKKKRSVGRGWWCNSASKALPNNSKQESEGKRARDEDANTPRRQAGDNPPTTSFPTRHPRAPATPSHHHHHHHHHHSSPIQLSRCEPSHKGVEEACLLIFKKEKKAPQPTNPDWTAVGGLPAPATRAWMRNKCKGTQVGWGWGGRGWGEGGYPKHTGTGATAPPLMVVVEIVVLFWAGNVGYSSREG